MTLPARTYHSRLLGEEAAKTALCIDNVHEFLDGISFLSRALESSEGERIAGISMLLPEMSVPPLL